MKIDPLRPVSSILAAMTAKREQSAGGQEPAAPPAPQPAPASQPGQPIPSVQMLVALAAADPERERRRRMAESGKRGIEQLELLHLELMSGEPSADRLRQLAEWVRQVEPPEDPALAAIIADIELRARVELAKLDIEV